MIKLIITVSLVILMVVFPTEHTEIDDLTIIPTPTPQTTPKPPQKPLVNVLATSTIALPPQLARICQCESGSKHFDANGEVLRGRVNPLDIGFCQINLYYHSNRASRLGFDLFTEYGNKGYAIWLYEKQGAAPWVWSKSCWNR